MSFNSIIDTTAKVSSLVRLMASIVFNDLCGMENHTYWTFEWSVKSAKSSDSETVFIKSS